MLSCRWQLLAFGRRMQFSKSVCIFIYMLLQLHFVRVRCVRQLFRFAAGGSFSFLLQVATFLLCCRRQLFSCAAGGSFSLVLQEAAFLLCCRRQLFFLAAGGSFSVFSAGGSFSLVLQEAAFSFSLQEAAFSFSLQEAALLSLRCSRLLQCVLQFPLRSLCDWSCTMRSFFFLPCAVLRREVEPVKA